MTLYLRETKFRKEEKGLIRENVISYIRQNGIKQKYLSEKTGLSPSAVSSIMNCKRDIEVDEYCAICKALNVSLDYFSPDSYARDTA